ncbi:hypothetical protein HMPREF0765_2417 [Sphingobacterium spiritivorum ATCC 33300]|uniref:SusD/RagB family nutrient-binding outer membrane lipoprotein n=1 Tax=Sphingobacterium spiritivorum ATCC 33300 TaxID=525372 RepID=C2FYL1_SPHSI|nr:RagB/SusD family nutrient uptake outer membrane protein [Sphingobacterium spiritivorum]EEI91957.1 hypothetical protein HMPREF0765_2417 [Sphingobacterium spiritivorum ATCC 33300]QQS96500.1 SusD/RagB family nutrient-binding outer membrane lipoprotein [Sphingobacterium spiritivorum]
MKMNNSLGIYLIGAMLILQSCTKSFEKYNTDPKGSTQEEVERDGYILASALTGMQAWVIPLDVNTCQFTECLLGGSYGGYLSDSNNGFNGKNFATYNPEENWLRVPFNDVIPNIFIRNVKVKSVTQDPIPAAVADIIKVLSISRVSSIYGPIPYSKIGAEGALNAPYDSEEEVYTKMFAELDAAIAVLTLRRTENFTPKADIVFGGNVIKWIKLANSLKLRLAMRILSANPSLAKTKAEEAVQHEIGPMLSNEDNAFAQPVSKNPFRVVMYEYNNGDSRISADITSYMNGYKDPRREKYFTVSTFTGNITNGYLGLRSGISIPSGENVKRYTNMNVGNTDKVLWMNAAEVAFLRAEGALRGWNMGTAAMAGSTPAEGFYKTGINLSFNQWGAAGATAYTEDSRSVATSYIDPLGAFSNTGSTSMITIKWNSAADMEQNLERIITQKWIANFPLGIEAWTEYRRTGYPKLMSVLQNNSGGRVNSQRMARRLPYPQDEYTENAVNVQNAVSTYLKGPDEMGTDLWWAKK